MQYVSDMEKVDKFQANLKDMQPTELFSAKNYWVFDFKMRDLL